MDPSDLSSSPFTLRTLRHRARKFLDHKILRRSCAKKSHLDSSAPRFPFRQFPYSNFPLFCYSPNNQENMASLFNPDESRRLHFGPFSVDLHAGELHKRGKKVKVQLLPLQLLGALLEKPGVVVTREELKSRLWAADTFVDFEHGLNTAIKKLRQALGDNPAKPALIETLPKKGYRFIGRLEANGASTAKNSSNSTELAGKIFSVFAEDGIACVVAPVDANSSGEWQRLLALGDDVGVAMMITNNRLGCLEVRILEGEHYGKTALLSRKSLRPL